MPNNSLFITVLVLVCYSGCCAAFGAGNIPSVAFLEGKAFRHGDIEDILTELLIRAASSNISTGFGAKSSGKKFSELNVKRTYFGNWLRDYSQAIDVGTLAKGLDVATIRLLVWVFGFLSFGYATAEFEVTVDRLGVYRPEEHIDNPKDYADNVDARQYDPRLRGPVDPREIQIDQRTGMKNYIANEQGGWATSTKYIRDSLLKAIDLGRKATVDADRYEALRLLGQSLHTLEDLTAHSNWIELALIELGYTQVFPHVGSNTQIALPNGKRVWPMITGTFGGVDFIHSLLGELGDHISQTSVTDLNAAINEAEQQNSQELYDKLKMLLSLVPSGQSDLEGIQANSQALGGSGSGGFHLQGQQGEGVALSAEEVFKKIYPIFALKDKISKTIVTMIDKIPGLKATVDEIKTDLTLYVLMVIQPFIKPILTLIKENVSKSSAMVMTDAAQYLVWNDPNSSDPTHSMLSKDHFTCYLNEPAGKVAKVIVRYAATQVVAAWSNTTVDPRTAVDSILQCFTHPALLNSSVKLHSDMLAVVKTWIDGVPQDRKQKILSGLTRDGVKQGLHHDTEKEKQEQQMFAKYNPQPTLPQLNSSYYGPGATKGLSGAALGSSSVGVGNYTSPSGYSTSTYQTYTASQRGISSGTNVSAATGGTTATGTAYAQGMTMDPASSKTVEYRMWPYNMDYYTQMDDYSLKFLSPYYHGMPSFLQPATGFSSGQSTYLQGSTITSGVPSMGTSGTGLGTNSGLGTGMVMSGVQAGIGSGTNLGSLSSSQSGLFSSGSGLVPQQSPGTIGVQSPSTNLMSSSTTGISGPSTLFNNSAQTPSQTPVTTPGPNPYTTQLNSSIPLTTGTGTSLPITTTSSIITPIVPLSVGLGTNSSFYGQVNDHGHSSPITGSPTLSTSTLHSTSPVNQVSSMQNSMQNMNLNV